MKYIKTYEDLDQRFKVGDYVIVNNLNIKFLDGSDKYTILVKELKSLCLDVSLAKVAVAGLEKVKLEDIIEKGDDAVPSADQIAELNTLLKEPEGLIEKELDGKSIGEHDAVEEMEESLMDDEGPEGHITTEEIEHEEDVIEEHEGRKNKRIKEPEEE